jgi:hypothetical protein
MDSALMQETSDPFAELGRQTICWELGEKSFVPDPIKDLGYVKANSHRLTMLVCSLTPEMCNAR